MDDAQVLRDTRVIKPYVVFEKFGLGVIGFISNSTAGLTLGAKDIR